MRCNFLAIDLGASSGRGVLGTLTEDRLVLDEVHRFANGPVERDGALRWDVIALEREIRRAVELARGRVERLDGLGVDSWGVDYVLLDGSGAAIEPPFHYRDQRTAGIMERVCERLGRADLFARSGIQFMPFNTLYQLAAHDPDRLAAADRLLMIADYFAHRLGGRAVGEVTLASTSQMLNARTRRWDLDLIERAGLPTGLLPPLVEAGAVVGDCAGVPVIATAAHDTAAAVAGCPAADLPPGQWAFLSSGTWSLLGVELDAPVLTDAALAANLGNELGVGGTVRLLRNISGLWLVQECRRAWAQAGREHTWDELVAQAEAAPPLAAVIDPDDPSLLAPADMPAALAELCQRTGQAPPESIGATVRLAIESVALKTRRVLEQLEGVIGRRVETIHMVGGGVNNRLLCRWTADATGRRVLAGPAEATAAGNLLTQAVGTGAIESFAAARRVLRDSIRLDEYEPAPSAAWDDALARLTACAQPQGSAAHPPAPAPNTTAAGARSRR